MYALEFYSTIHDGNIIKIPQEYTDKLEKLGQHIKVIILSDEHSHPLPAFNAVSLQTKGFVFDREYANEG